jgi:hypothetical protein
VRNEERIWGLSLLFGQEIQETEGQILKYLMLSFQEVRKMWGRHTVCPTFYHIELLFRYIYISRLAIGFKSAIDWALILSGEMV